MRQRAMIAMALAQRPVSLLIADEPTTALDVTVQAADPRPACANCSAEFGTAIIMITHDLGVVADDGRRGRRDVRRQGSWNTARSTTCLTTVRSMPYTVGSADVDASVGPGPARRRLNPVPRNFRPRSSTCRQGLRLPPALRLPPVRCRADACRQRAVPDLDGSSESGSPEVRCHHGAAPRSAELFASRDQASGIAIEEGRMTIQTSTGAADVGHHAGDGRPLILQG
jgi:ABC-type dipeptide/oligopeptide/nickel transport system ATPase component